MRIEFEIDNNIKIIASVELEPGQIVTIDCQKPIWLNIDGRISMIDLVSQIKQAVEMKFDSETKIKGIELIGKVN